MRSSTPLTKPLDSSVPKRLRELDGLVEDDRARHVGAEHELPRAEPEEVAIDARHALEAPVAARRP